MTSSNANPAGGDGGARQISVVQEHSVTSRKSQDTQPALPITISQWAKNAREQIIVRLGKYNGRPTIEARVWFRDDAGELRPSRSGLTVSLKHLPQIAAAYADALVEARERGLLPQDEGGGA